MPNPLENKLSMHQSDSIKYLNALCLGIPLLDVSSGTEGVS